MEEGKYDLQAGNPKKARGIFENVIKKYADTGALAEARYYRARALHKEGRTEDYAKALIAFVKNRSDSPHWPDATVELADLYHSV